MHTIADLSPQSGGTARVVRDLTDALSVKDDFAKIMLLSQHRPGARIIAAKPDSEVEQQLGCSRSDFALRLGWPLKKLIDSVIVRQRPDLLHDHGIWMLSNHFVAATAKRYGIPLLVHSHGMLEPWALDYHAWKKRLALWLYQRRDLEAATLFFATAQQEVESLRHLGLKQPVAIIPNGVELPLLAHKRGGKQRASLPGSLRNAVFMSRIHPKKGLINLVEAWGRVQPEHWRLRVAGPVEGGHLTEVMQRVRALGLEASVEYVGEVEGNTKTALFESADLFVLPSFSENFGVVVAEALAHGVPVITTRGTPWEGLLHHTCGWWIEPTVDALTEALQRAINMDREGLQAMGVRGQEYACEFDWSHIARQTMEVYRWVLGEGLMPTCVVLD